MKHSRAFMCIFGSRVRLENCKTTWNARQTCIVQMFLMYWWKCSALGDDDDDDDEDKDDGEFPRMCFYKTTKRMCCITTTHTPTPTDNIWNLWNVMLVRLPFSVAGWYSLRGSTAACSAEATAAAAAAAEGEELQRATAAETRAMVYHPITSTTLLPRTHQTTHT